MPNAPTDVDEPWREARSVDAAEYDPDGLFIVHHGVGSESWSNERFTRRK